jgi:hypothetical protein
MILGHSGCYHQFVVAGTIPAPMYSPLGTREGHSLRLQCTARSSRHRASSRFTRHRSRSHAHTSPGSRKTITPLGVSLVSGCLLSFTFGAKVRWNHEHRNQRSQRVARWYRNREPAAKEKTWRGSGRGLSASQRDRNPCLGSLSTYTAIV